MRPIWITSSPTKTAHHQVNCLLASVYQPPPWLLFVHLQEQPPWERAGESGNGTEDVQNAFAIAVTSHFYTNRCARALTTNFIICNTLIPKAPLRHCSATDFYSDLAKPMHNCAHFCTRGLYKAKEYANYAKEIFPYQAGTQKGTGGYNDSLGGYCQVC